MAAVCTEAGVMVRADVLQLEKPWLAGNHSDVSQIAGVVLTNAKKTFLFVTQVWVALEL